MTFPAQMMRGLAGSLLLGVGAMLLAGCGGSEATCDARIVEAFRALPPVEGVDVDLHGSPGIGCTDTVTPADPDAFMEHYERAMRKAGWEVVTDSSGTFGRGASGGVRLDRLEGDDVGVYALSRDEVEAPGE